MHPQFTIGKMSECIHNLQLKDEWNHPQFTIEKWMNASTIKEWVNASTIYNWNKGKAWCIPSPKNLTLWPMTLKINRAPDSLKRTKYAPLKDVDSRVFTRMLRRTDGSVTTGISLRNFVSEEIKMIECIHNLQLKNEWMHPQFTIGKMSECIHNLQMEKIGECIHNLQMEKIGECIHNLQQNFLD